jgi:hypothetical protein
MSTAESVNFTTGSQTARRFGVHEIELRGNGAVANPFDTRCQATFTAPSGQQVTVDAFYDGGDTWRARVYVNEIGGWRWRISSADAQMNGQRGEFAAATSNLRGMLRKHPRNAKQWATDDGRWFLNLNDTAYMLCKSGETAWQQYAAEDWALGITSLRVGGLGGASWAQDDPDTSWPWLGDDLTRYNLARFQTSDARLIWLLDRYPDLYLQFILFGLLTWGKDDTGAAWAALPVSVRENTMRYMLARWAAFPQLFWLIVNDIHCTAEFPLNQAFEREVGRFFAAHDPWHHLLSTGPKRQMAFPFLHPQDEWVSYVHIEDLFALDAAEIQLYADQPLHVFLGEDRYEHDRRTWDPLDPAYFFRWLFWSWTLAGGSASYGGRWRTITPYSQTGAVPYATGWGSEDEITYTQGLRGLDSLIHLKRYFEQRELTMLDFVSDDALVSDLDGRGELHRPKLARRGNEEYLIYHPNARLMAEAKSAASGATEGIAQAARLREPRYLTVDGERAARLRVDLREAKGTLRVEWFRAADGLAQDGGTIQGGGYRELIAPWTGCDVVLRLTPYS